MTMESSLALNVTQPLTNLSSFAAYGTFMAILGSIGNLLAFLVSLRPKVKGTSFSVFLGGMAIADSMVLWAQAFLLLTYFKTSQAFCMTRPFLLMFPEAQANWIIAGLTVERALMINWPMKANAFGLGKQKSGLLFLATICAIVICFHIPTLFFLQWDSENPNICFARDKLAYASGKIYPWMTVTLFFYLPMLTIAFCNLSIVRKLLASTSDKMNDKKQERLRRITVTVSLVSAVYVALEICNAIIRTVVALNGIDALNPKPEFFGSMMACQTNHGINIILYCLTGDQFREEFFSLIRSICCLKQSDKTESTSASTSKSTGTRVTKVAA